MASVIEKGALRYTPAGLPAIDVMLRHESQQAPLAEESRPRTVAFEIRGRAIGAVAEALNGAALGTPRSLEGFLGGNRNGRGVVLHIERIA